MTASAKLFVANSSKADTLSTSTSVDKAEQEKQEKQKEQNEFKVKKIGKSLLEIDYKCKKFLSTNEHVELDNNKKKSSNFLIQILVEPLEKRFKFHFFGNRKTNNLDKVNFNSYTCFLHVIDKISIKFWLLILGPDKINFLN